MRREFYYLILPFFVVLLFQCTSDTSSEDKTEERSAFTELSGKTMGTFYHIQYRDTENRDLKGAVDSIFHLLDKIQLSTYNPKSVISRLNHAKENKTVFNVKSDYHFVQNLIKSEEVYHTTRGNFDPTVLPLVNYWGFGAEKRENSPRDSAEVEALLKRVGFPKVKIERKPDSIIVEKPVGVELDFSAIAKGYAAREIGVYLKSLGIQDIYVEVGGELFLAGKNPKNGWWRIGVNLPSVDADVQDIYQVLQVSDNCVASSGNYRNYYIENGRMLSHTINPKTGFPERNSLLSATVIGPDGAMTDAFATAGMVMGWRPFLKLIEKQKGYECFLIYTTSDGEMKNVHTTGMAKYLVH